MKANKTPENYPMQFKDKIDEYLWKEHHILGGCCSSIENMKYTVAREVTEKLTDAFIEKACEWLNKELPITDLSPSNMLDITFKVFDKECKKEFIEDFKKYMED